VYSILYEITDYSTFPISVYNQIVIGRMGKSEGGEERWVFKNQSPPFPISYRVLSDIYILP